MRVFILSLLLLTSCGKQISFSDQQKINSGLNKCEDLLIENKNLRIEIDNLKAQLKKAQQNKEVNDD